MRSYLLTIAFLVLVAACARVPAPVVPPPAPRAPATEPKTGLLNFEATAYSIQGKTASGSPARQGVVAADPDVLPLGSRIRIEGAGRYSGEYLVADTGRTIRGREIDIFIADHGEARRFGRRDVKVEILADGHGRRDVQEPR